MAVEVELKAHLDDFEPVKERLSSLGRYYRSYQKSDSYWLGPQAAPTLRIRRESGVEADGTAYESVTATFKAKEITGGIEVNDEREFTVSDAALFEELLCRLGMSTARCKEKKGWAWHIAAEEAGQAESAKRPGSASRPLILAELSLVKDLGWFLELEIMLDGECKQDIAESRRRLLALLARLEVSADKIEERPYTVLLSLNPGLPSSPLIH